MTSEKTVCFKEEAVRLPGGKGAWHSREEIVPGLSLEGQVEVQDIEEDSIILIKEKQPEKRH